MAAIFCYLVSLILAILAAIGIGPPKFHLGWAAFAFFVLAHLVGGLGLR